MSHSFANRWLAEDDRSLQLDCVAEVKWRSKERFWGPMVQNKESKTGRGTRITKTRLVLCMLPKPSGSHIKRRSSNVARMEKVLTHAPCRTIFLVYSKVRLKPVILSLFSNSSSLIARNTEDLLFQSVLLTLLEALLLT